MFSKCFSVSPLWWNFTLHLTDVAIPTGIPIVYKFDKKMNPIPPSVEKQTASQIHMSGLFLEKPGLLREALVREAEWAAKVPGYNSTLTRRKTSMTALERSLYKLQAERELGDWAGQFVDPSKMVDDGNDGNMQKLMDDIWARGIAELEAGEQFDPDGPEFHEAARDVPSTEKEDESIPVANLISNNQPCIKSIPSASLVPGMGSVPVRRDSVIVMIRHGKTEHNKLGLFTGWEVRIFTSINFYPSSILIDILFVPLYFPNLFHRMLRWQWRVSPRPKKQGDYLKRTALSLTSSTLVGCRGTDWISADKC